MEDTNACFARLPPVARRENRAERSALIATVRLTVKYFRRALIALGIAGLIAAVLRVRGTGGVPPQGGGWRELSGPELR